METHQDDVFLTPLLEVDSDGDSANDDAFPREEVTRSQAIPPPALKGTSELRLKRNPSPLAVADYGAVFVWGQGDAYDIPRDVPLPSDLTEMHPQLRETVKPGRVA